MFLDQAEVQFTSGRGGQGSASFHREKHVPLGGPNGADGGRGGDIVLIADKGRRTLYDFKLQSVFRAQNGSDAVGNKRGKDAPNVEVRVPVGTTLIDLDINELIVDLNLDGMRFIVCKGGKGGFGNLHYVNSVRQAPSFAQMGAPGESVRVQLELSLLADVGLIGLPNAGKSTLLSRITAAKPKIADYPFTTIEPNLGVVSVGHETFTVADLPGLIEGANEGRGLGHQFLKHAQRTKLLIHLVECLPVDETDPIHNFRLIEEELKSYSDAIHSRPRVVALSKSELISQPRRDELVTALSTFGFEVFEISAVTGMGIDRLLHATVAILEKSVQETPVPIIVPAMRGPEDLSWEVTQEEGNFVVRGKRIERMVSMTDLRNDEALRYLHRRLERIGVIGRLREFGAAEGDTVRIGDTELAFSEDL